MMIRTQVLFPRDLLSELQLIAREYGWSVSETVRRFVTEKVKRVKPKKMSGVEAMLNMAKNAYKGKVPPDLSTNDDYLYGKLAPDYPFKEKRK